MAEMTPERLAEIRALKPFHPLPWFLVGPPWGNNEYAVSGREDPHVGHPVIERIEVDSVECENDEDIDEKWAEAEARQDADLWYAVNAVNALPEVLALLDEAVEVLEDGRPTLPQHDLWWGGKVAPFLAKVKEPKSDGA